MIVSDEMLRRDPRTRKPHVAYEYVRRTVSGGLGEPNVTKTDMFWCNVDSVSCEDWNFRDNVPD